MQRLSLRAMVAMTSELNCSLDGVNQKLELSTLRPWNNEMAVDKVEWPKTSPGAGLYRANLKVSMNQYPLKCHTSIYIAHNPIHHKAHNGLAPVMPSAGTLLIIK